MAISVKTVNRCLVATVTGELDHHLAPIIRETLDKHIKKGEVHHLILDFSALTFMDSSGIGVIIGRYRLTENNGGKTMLACLGPGVTRIFEISGLKRIIKSADSVDEAVKCI